MASTIVQISRPLVMWLVGKMETRKEGKWPNIYKSINFWCSFSFMGVLIYFPFLIVESTISGNWL